MNDASTQASTQASVPREQKRRIDMIVAIDSKNGIGLKGEIPWNIPGDLKNFQYKTYNSVVIMGRRTWESIPSQHRPLKNRLNVVLTTDIAFGSSDSHDIAYAVSHHVKVFHSFESCMEWIDNDVVEGIPIYVIGGKHVYDWFLTRDLIQEACITTIDHDYGCDVVLDSIQAIDDGNGEGKEGRDGRWQRKTVDELTFIEAENAARIRQTAGANYRVYMRKYA